MTKKAEREQREAEERARQVWSQVPELDKRWALLKVKSVLQKLKQEGRIE